MIGAIEGLLRWVAYPCVMAGSLWATVRLSDMGLSEAPAVLIVTSVASLVVIILERVIPYATDWNASHGDLRTDACHLAFTNAMVEVVRTGLTAGLVVAAATVATWGGANVWPVDWPIVAQVALALVVGELGGYWAHRWMHQTALWRIHAIHHSAPRMYWLNAWRMHPLDSSFALIMAFSPLVLLGAPAETLTLYGVYTVVHQVMHHSNVDAHLGPFNRVFAMAEVHRWHHSRLRPEMDANYGTVLLLWDSLFGTRYVPESGRLPREVGLAEAHGAFPTGYLGQLRVPFDSAYWRNVEAR